MVPGSIPLRASCCQTVMTRVFTWKFRQQNDSKWKYSWSGIAASINIYPFAEIVIIICHTGMRQLFGLPSVEPSLVISQISSTLYRTCKFFIENLCWFNYLGRNLVVPLKIHLLPNIPSDLVKIKRSINIHVSVLLSRCAAETQFIALLASIFLSPKPLRNNNFRNESNKSKVY